MPIRVERISEDLQAIACCTASPGDGASRPTFSQAWGDACLYVIAEVKKSGAEVRIDAAGNVHARPAKLGWEVPAWLVGSHIDSVPHGGDYDGVAGVIVGVELLRSAKEDGVNALPVELVIFAEEEGPTFGLGMLGSRAWVGELSAEKLATLTNQAGQSYPEAGGRFGVVADGIAAAKLNPARYLGLIELHIEQGPGMWRRDQRLAVVSAIAGRRQYRATIEGEANHAGATAMTDRRDALAAAAEMVTGLERLAGEVGRSAVITVGRLQALPGAVNVISNRVEMTIDFRSPEDVELDLGDRKIRGLFDDVLRRRGLKGSLLETENIPARPMNKALVQAAIEAAAAVGQNDLPVTVSGALHDSAVLAPYVPTVMLFVPSRDGISHNPAEFSRYEDIAQGAAVVERMVRGGPRRLEMLNSCDGSVFVTAVGPAFEHSPWIAERAVPARPFASVDALHAAMIGVVERATEVEKLSLIRAHPDLVGRLAREGKLTRESNSEQAAAGLTRLSADEVATFERHNAAYREKFGFPFVICARENKKDAILQAFPRRLANDRSAEIAAALNEIAKIARLRLYDLFAS